MLEKFLLGLLSFVALVFGLIDLLWRRITYLKRFPINRIKKRRWILWAGYVLPKIVYSALFILILLVVLVVLLGALTELPISEYSSALALFERNPLWILLATIFVWVFSALGLIERLILSVINWLSQSSAFRRRAN